MEKGKQPNGRQSSKLRRIRVSVVYGKMRLAECMEYVIRAKSNLR